MPVQFRVLPEFNLVITCFVGEVTTEEHIKSFLQYAGDPFFDGRQHALVDMRACRMDQSYFDDMARLAYKLKGYYEVRATTSRTSVYAPGDVAFGMTRMYQSIAADSPWKMDVFRSKQDTLAFLDFRPDAPETAQVADLWEAFCAV